MRVLKNNIVFIVSLAAAAAIVAVGIINPELLEKSSGKLHKSIIDNFGWGYLISAFIFLLFSLFIAFSRFGKLKLGNDYEKPQYSYFGWFSMLFAAGMGIGIIFWGVAEPMSHYLNPPDYIAKESGTAANFAMQYSFFHWGLQPWAIYITMSLAIAYFSFRRGMPTLISSCFYPLIGDKIYGTIGKLIDILAVFATLFGIVTSLGLGAMQISSGLGSVFGFADSFGVTVIIIAAATVLFLISSMTGLDKGIQILSKANILLAILLLLFMLVAGPTSFILNVFTNTLADYMSNLLNMSLSTNPFRSYEWTQSWTIFYWAWWISWSPFVGLFVASISRGRTIREFVVGSLVVPTLLTFVWFSVFGGAAFNLELGGADIAGKVAENVSVGLFELYNHFSFSTGLTLVTVALLAVFFVTSADSATFVLAMMTSNGKRSPSAAKKIVWGITVSSTAVILLSSGGLDALRKMSIAAALPFTAIMLFMCYSLLKGLKYEYKQTKLKEPQPENPAEQVE